MAGKSLLAIMAGLALGIVLSLLTDTAFEKAGILKTNPFSDNTTGFIVVIILYRTLYNVLGCYLAARLAPGRPMQHAMIIGVIGFVFSIAGTIAMKDISPGWYGISLIVLALPAAWLGGKLGTQKSK